MVKDERPQTKTPKENPEGEPRRRTSSLRGRQVPYGAGKFPTGQASSVPGKYLYCIIKEKKPKKPRTRAKLGAGLVQNRNGVSSSGFNILGQEGKEVYTLNEAPKESLRDLSRQGDLAIVVSDTSKEEYSFIKEHLICHQRVIEEVMGQGYDVLPVRFGTVAPNTKYVKEKLLKAKTKELLETFKIVEGRVELGVRAFWQDMSKIFQEIVAENREIQRAKKAVQKNPSSFKMAEVGELIQKALEIKREREAQEILTPLRKLAINFKERELLRNREVMKDSMILSSAFLVPKENMGEFDRKMEELINVYNKRIKFIYVGPIPPFNFVELHLEV